MTGKLSEVRGDYKTARLATDAVTMRQSSDAADEGQEQDGGCGEQETVHKPSSPLETLEFYRQGIRVFLSQNIP
jgi:hypothetical protein